MQRTKYVFGVMAVSLVCCGRLLESALTPPPDAPPSKQTRRMVGGGLEPLKNVPVLGAPFQKGHMIYVPVTNRGSTTLVCSGSPGGRVDIVLEVARGGAWDYESHDWCQLIESTVKILPGQTKELGFSAWSHWRAERALLRFHEKGTLRFDWVVIARE